MTFHEETSGGVLTKERFRVAFTAISKHEFVSHDLLNMLSVHYFYPTISSFMLFLFMTIVFSQFELLIFCFVKFSTRIWCTLPFASNVSQISLNIVSMKFPIFQKKKDLDGNGKTVEVIVHFSP